MLLVTIQPAAVVVQVKAGDRWRSSSTHPESIKAFKRDVPHHEKFVVRQVIQSLAHIGEEDKLLCSRRFLSIEPEPAVALVFSVEDDADGAALFQLVNGTANLFQTPASVNLCKEGCSVRLDNLQLVERVATRAPSGLMPMWSQEHKLLPECLSNLALTPEHK